MTQCEGVAFDGIALGDVDVSSEPLVEAEGVLANRSVVPDILPHPVVEALTIVILEQHRLSDPSYRQKDLSFVHLD